MLKTTSFKIIGFLIVIVVIGFGSYKFASKPKTVEYYLANIEEMKAKIKECNNDPATLRKTGNCTNAEAAMSKHIFDQGKENSKSISNAIRSGF